MIPGLGARANQMMRDKFAHESWPPTNVFLQRRLCTDEFIPEGRCRKIHPIRRGTRSQAAEKIIVLAIPPPKKVSLKGRGFSRAITLPLTARL